MKASLSREIAQKNKDTGLNYQTRQVMKFIKDCVKNGEFELQLCEAIMGSTILFEEDYVFFEKLGYKVKRPEKYIKDNFYYKTPIIISW